MRMTRVMPYDVETLKSLSRTCHSVKREVKSRLYAVIVDDPVMLKEVANNVWISPHVKAIHHTTQKGSTWMKTVPYLKTFANLHSLLLSGIDFRYNKSCQGLYPDTLQRSNCFNARTFATFSLAFHPSNTWASSHLGRIHSQWPMSTARVLLYARRHTISSRMV